MPETAGLLLVGAIAPGAITGIGFGSSIAGASFLGINIATAVGTAAILGASIGLQYALNNKSIPRPESGSQSIRQSIPPRVRGYGVNRLSGYYMLYDAADSGGPPANSYDVMALHSGRVTSFLGFYLSDDRVSIVPSVAFGGTGIVQGTFGDFRYEDGSITIETRLGASSQAAVFFTSDPAINGRWTSAHVGNGIAYVAMECSGIDTPDRYTRIYPRGKPELSAIVLCSPVWDPRDPAQSRDDPDTWQTKFNPVLQLIDYLTAEDGGMGLDFDEILPPERLAEWMVEADLCDELVDKSDGGQEPRYQSNGWYTYDTSPEEVINAILATCDGWMAESGDGTLSLVVGVYREPSDPPLTEDHILGYQLNYGAADEQLVNVLKISFTDPANKYVTTDLGEWRDEESISSAGIERSKALDLKWVQSSAQGSRLADRAMQRVNPLLSGKLITTLYGLRYLGGRWIPVQYPYASGTQNSIFEVQGAEVDLLGGRITWDFILIKPDTIEAYNPFTDEISAPIGHDTIPVSGINFGDRLASGYLALFEDI